MMQFVSRRSRSVTLFACAGLVMGASAMAGSGQTGLAADPEPLFTPINEAVLGSVDNPAVVRQRDLRAAGGLGELFQRGVGDTLSLNLFDDVSFVARKTAVEQPTPRAQSWVGGLEGDTEGLVILTVVDDAMYGEIETGGVKYRLVGTGDRITVEEIDPGALLPCAQDNFDHAPTPHELAALEAEQGIIAPAEAPVVSEVVGGRGTTPLIDVLVFYTPLALTRVSNNPALMESTIGGFISYTNQAYDRSGVNQRVRVVHIAQTNYTEATSGMDTDLSRFRSASDGHMDEVHALRIQYGGDLMHLITGNTSQQAGACGIAYLMTNPSTGFRSSAFGVTSWFCGSSTFAHELGHNMGCAHDHDNGSVGAYCWSFGYRTPNNQYRTLMAYAPGSTVPVFSSPDVTWNGWTMGIGGCSATAADNVTSMNSTSTIVEAFRPSVVDNPAPSAFGPTAPLDGAVGVRTNPTIDWQDAQHATQYEVVVSLNPDLSSPVYQQTTPTSAVTLPFNTLENETVYYWGVTATNIAGDTTMTPEVATFTTKNIGDTNSDGLVNFTDLNNVLATFGLSGLSLIGDTNIDGVVNFTDLNNVLTNFGNSQHN